MGLGGKNRCHKMRGGQPSQSWQGHFYEMPSKVHLLQGMALKPTSASPAACRPFSVTSSFQLALEMIPHPYLMVDSLAQTELG